MRKCIICGEKLGDHYVIWGRESLCLKDKCWFDAYIRDLTRTWNKECKRRGWK